MWINREVDLPQTLITAQREGKLVIFAGAGVSMGPPANLPSFSALAEAVASGTLTQKPGETLDAFLGRVEQRGIDVQARTRALIDVATSKPTKLHRLLVSLFKDAPSVRLVTTNFDRHFTTTLREKHADTEIFIGPALPVGRDCLGLIYLHGAVERPRSHLVLTDRDFGQAYLADGWATRFLMEMFAKFSVLFVGYSHTDPVMRYLARSFVGGTSRFALTAPGQDDHWTNLGIAAVHFPVRSTSDRFGAIDDAIEAWTNSARMGVFDHQVRIAQLVQGAPPLEPENLDYLRSIFTDAVKLRFFVENAKSPDWLEWTESQGFLEPLTRPAPIMTREPQLLAHWFATMFSTQHPREALAFVQRHGRTLNGTLSDALVFHLSNPSTEVTSNVLRLWAAALLNLPATTPRALERLLRKSVDLEDRRTAFTLFRFLIRPRLVFDPTWAVLAADDEARDVGLSVEVSLGADPHELRRAWDRLLKADLQESHGDLLALASDWVSESHDLLFASGRAADDWDPMSYQRSAIEPHGQDHTSDKWGLAVDIARDALEWTIAHDPGLASAILESWAASRPLLLRRLAIHGASKRADIPPHEFLALIVQNEWLYASSMKHEVFELLRTAFAGSDEASQEAFIAHSMTAPVIRSVGEDPETQRTVDYERYNVAVWLARVAPASEVAARHLAELQQRYQEFGPRDHPDMAHWISAGSIQPRSPKTNEELAAMSFGDAAKYLSEYEPETPSFRGPDRGGLMAALKQASTSTEWALGLAGELITQQIWKRDIWSALLEAWRAAPLDQDALRRIVGLLERHPRIGQECALEVANMIEKAIDDAAVDETDINRLELIGERLLAYSDSKPPSVHSEGNIDWLTSAINHPAGQVALTWIKGVSKRMGASGEQWRGLPDDVRSRVEALLGGTGPNAQLARVVFASQLHFLLNADRAWATHALVPLFDWDRDAAEAKRAWDAFVFWGRWNDALFEDLRPYVLQTILRITELGEQADRFTAALAAVAAFSQVDPWHRGGWLFSLVKDAPVEHRARWAAEFGRCLESLSPDGVDRAWNNWLFEYWQERLTGVPQPLADSERQALVGWVPGLGTHVPDAVDLVLRAPPTRLDHFAFYLLRQSGIATTHAQDVGRLLAGVLTGLEAVQFDTGELHDLAITALENGARAADLSTVAKEMMRLGCPGAEDLQHRVNGSGPSA